MKKNTIIFGLLMIFCIGFVFSACGGAEANTPTADEIVLDAWNTCEEVYLSDLETNANISKSDYFTVATLNVALNGKAKVLSITFRDGGDSNLSLSYNDSKYFLTIDADKKISSTEEETYTQEEAAEQGMSLSDGALTVEKEKLPEVLVVPSAIGDEKITSIPANCFEGTDVKEVVIPDTITSLSDACFNNCASLEKVTIYDGCETIGSYAFSFCPNLAEIVLPNSVTTLGENAFRDCLSLKEITIGSGVQEIKSECFAYSGVTEIVLDGSYTLGAAAFRGCKSLTKVTIGGGILTIPFLCFSECEALSDLTICDGVTSSGDWNSFAYCTSLTSVTLPNSFTKVGSYTFSGCTNLESVTIGTGITEIADHVFVNCSNLKFLNLKVSEDNAPSFGSAWNSGVHSDFQIVYDYAE